MTASGDGGAGPEARPMMRRPAIRRRPISAPRVTNAGRTLPPARTPAVRPAPRPTLVLVAEEDVREPSASHVSPALHARAAMPWALVGIATALATLAGIGVAWVASRPAARTMQASQPVLVATTTLNAASIAMAPKAQAAPEVPVVDVHSLPPARR